MRIRDIAAAAGGKLVGGAEGTASGVVIDSRKVVPGSVFVAVRGERTDGHNYIASSFDKGAACVICERIPEDFVPSPERPCIVVNDSLEALRRLAAEYRKTLTCKVIGIIGSVGKTSTKELVASVLSQRFRTSRTDGNFNNGIGVPLTILAIPTDAEMAVVEMGISDFGEMDMLGSIAKPDAVVMTNIGPCHLEKLGNLSGVLRAKSEVFKHMAAGSAVFVNTSDSLLERVVVPHCTMLGYAGTAQTGAAHGPAASEAAGIAQTGAAHGPAASRTMGTAQTFSTATDVTGHGLEGSSFTLSLGGFTRADSSQAEPCSVRAEVKLPGEHMVTNALAAALVGRYYGMTAEEITAGIAAAVPMAGRSNLIRTDRLLIVDDCYNANPRSMRAAIDMMKYASGRSVVILGDMFELGGDEVLLHREIGEYVAAVGVSAAVYAGRLAKNMFDGAAEAYAASGKAHTIPPMRSYYFDSTAKLLEALAELPFEKGDTVLVKASHGMNFADVVEQLKKL